jgi:hypothetical protein|tara:strand:+ start:2507 stop:3706 length:1200 start_codon:yes stop_codon:yes gene_type:complete
MTFRHFLLLLLASISWSTLEAATNHKKKSYEIELRHPGINSNKPKIHTLYQIQDAHGLIIGYSMVVDSVICKEATCEVVNVTMTWDALGQYQSYKLDEGIELEKVKIPKKKKTIESKVNSYAAIPFSSADNKKLDQILKEKHSPLKTRTLENVTNVHKENEDIDFVASPTPPTIKNAVIEGAALTCFHLWHWANGDVVKATKELTHQSCSEKQLSHLVASEKPHYVLFALEHLIQHKLYSLKIVKLVNDQMQNEAQQSIIDLGYLYLNNAIPSKEQFQDNLATIFSQSNNHSRILLLQLLEAKKELPDALIEKMITSLPLMKDYDEINAFLNMLEKLNYASPAVLTNSAKVLENNNFFIARRAYWYLEEKSLDKQNSDLVLKFREKSLKEDRNLKRIGQ